ncbi:MAG TPA: porin [Myxococcota bacterium]|nr:porin [Myxococcota bacterium]
MTRGLLLAALWVLPGAARGEEPAPAPAPVQEPAEESWHLEHRFAWDGAPTYEVWALTPDQITQELKLVQDFGIVGRVGASLFVDYGYDWSANPDDRNGWDAQLRRLRIETLGRVSYGIDTYYKVSLGAEEGRFYLNDFWLGWYPTAWFERVRFGYIDPPFSLEQLTSSTERSFMEAAAPVSAFAPGYRLGLEGRNRWLDPDVALIGSLSSVGQSQQFSDASDSPFRASLRAAWRPGGVPDDPNAALLHLGLSFGYSFSGSGDIHYRARPESSISPYLVDTGDIQGDAAQVGVEFARRAGPLTLQGEWIGSFVSSSDFGSRFFHGGYFETAYMMTGEIRPYDARSGLFTPIQPKVPFDWDERSFGSLELAARISYINLSDGPVHGGSMTTLNGGVVWGLNRWARIHFDAIWATVHDRPGPGSNLIGQMRIELSLN